MMADTKSEFLLKQITIKIFSKKCLFIFKSFLHSKIVYGSHLRKVR